MTLRTQLAYVAAALLIVLGLLAFIAPVFAAGLLGLAIPSPRGVSAMRSGYGAVPLAMGVLALWAIPLRPKKAPLLRTLSILLAAAAAGRLFSIGIDGVFAFANLLLFLLQASVALLVFWASTEQPPSRAELRARRDAAEARDQAASARLYAVEAERRARASAGGGHERTPDR
jgi:hypothetical protein